MFSLLFMSTSSYKLWGHHFETVYCLNLNELERYIAYNNIITNHAQNYSLPIQRKQTFLNVVPSLRL